MKTSRIGSGMELCSGEQVIWNTFETVGSCQATWLM